MSANVDAMVKEAIRAYRANRKDEAHALLVKATELDDHHEQAWMWLSAVVESVDDQMICLENVLAINPENADAKRGLDLLKAKQSALPKSNPFTNVDDTWGDVDADTSGFMSDLDLGIKSRAPKLRKQTFDDLRSSIDENYQTGFESAFDSGVFPDQFDEPEPTSSAVDEYAEFEDPLQASASTRLDTIQSAPPSAPPPPARERIKKNPPAKPAMQDDIDFDILDQGVPEDDLDAIFNVELDEGRDNTRTRQDDDILQRYFAQIPTEIRPTRVPGADERYSPLLMPLLVLLVIGNIAAALLLLA